MTEDPTDLNLVIAARAGDRVSFAILLKRHCPRLLALADADVLRSVLDTLPETYRVALILHDAQGLSASELAEAMDIPLGTAKSHIRRGRMALVSRLAEDDQGLLEGVR